MKKLRIWWKVALITPVVFAVAISLFIIFCSSIATTSEKRLGEIGPILRRIGLVFEDVERSPTKLSDAVERLRLSWIDRAQIYGRTFLRRIRYGTVKIVLWPITYSWRKIFDTEYFSTPGCTSLGFGQERCGFTMEHALFRDRVYMIVQTHRGRIIEAKVSCFEECIGLFAPGWNVQDVKSVVGQGAEIQYEADVDTRELVIRFQNKQVYKSATRERGEALGYMRPVEVPPELREFYELLTSPYMGFLYSEFTHEWVSALQRAGRIDLLWNMARGPNPTGRIAAIKALQYSDPEGLKTRGKRLVAAVIASRTPIYGNFDGKGVKLASEIINGGVIGPAPEARKPLTQLASDLRAITPNSKVLGGALSIHGKLPKRTIHDVIERNVEAIDLCYEYQLITNPSLKGIVDVKFVISTDGAVSSAVIDRSTLNNVAFTQCIVNVVKLWRFPAPEFGVEIVTYAFKFEPSGDGKTSAVTEKS
jgi:hypothetical protein